MTSILVEEVAYIVDGASMNPTNGSMQKDGFVSEDVDKPRDGRESKT